MRSRDKGARGEREAAQWWALATGATCRRGQQFSGSPDSPDVVTSQAGIHLEVKRVERGNPYDWVDQAVRDAETKCPVVLHRRNNRPWLVVVRLSDVMRLAQALVETAPKVGELEIPADVSRAGGVENREADGSEPRDVLVQRRRDGDHSPAEYPG